MFSGSTFASGSKNVEQKEFKVQATPTATLSPLSVWLKPYQTQEFRVGTTSSYGPHIFYFNGGDGSSTKVLSGRGNETHRYFPHYYTAPQQTMIYNYWGQTADQLNISPKRYGTAYVNAY